MIATSHDGQWAIVRRGREVVLLAGGAGAPVGRLELETDDVDLALVGPPTMVAVITRGAGAAKLLLHQPPHLDAVARLDLEPAMKLATVSGPRLVMVSADGKVVQLVRAAGRALSSQTINTGSPVEFAVGLERNQVLFSLLRKLEVWDAVSARPLLRLQLQLPPPPRTVGAAQGHVWVVRPGSDEVFVYRLSDGRPFRHQVGSPVADVVCHPASPLIVLVTSNGLIRLHCFAHSLAAVDTPWKPGMPLAQLPADDEVSLLGIGDGDMEPWRIPISGGTAPVVAGDVVHAEEATPAPTTAADTMRALRERVHGGVAVPSVASEVVHVTPDPPTAADRLRALRSSGFGGSSPTAVATVTAPVPPLRSRMWREPLAAYGAELVQGVDGELPLPPVDSELGELAHRLALPSAARRALVALYSLYLVGDPMLSIARLSRALIDWTEALGQGELGALAMLRRHGGKVGLRSSVTDLLDGAPPRSIRVVGGAATDLRRGVTRLARDGKSDVAIETELASQLGRIAVIEGAATLGVLEARLHGATALALAPPSARPMPWPREAGLIIVADAAAPAWVSALPAYC